MNYEIFDLSIRILFLALLPAFVATVVASLLVTALQTVTALQEPALGYVVRVVAFAASVYLVLPATIESLNELLLRALQ